MPGRMHLVAVTAIAVSGVAGCGSDGRQPAAGAPGMHGIGATAAPAVTATAVPAVPAAAIEAARKVVAPNTDGTPFTVVRTEYLTPGEAQASDTSHRSEDVAKATDGAPAYLITFRGDFVGYGVSYPFGAQPPRGRCFTVGINGADMSVSGFSITPDEPAPLHPS